MSQEPSSDISVARVLVGEIEYLFTTSPSNVDVNDIKTLEKLLTDALALAAKITKVEYIA